MRAVTPTRIAHFRRELLQSTSSTEKVAVSVMNLISPVTSGTVFFKLSKLLHQEDALSVPCFRLMSESRLQSPGHHLDAFLVVGADARAERGGARPSRAVVARRR
jgi:hypothetical protein